MTLDRSGSLAVTTRPPWPETVVQDFGSSSTYGKANSTVANAASIYVACDCTAFPVNYIDWLIQSDQQYTYQFYRANSNPIAATITLDDATAVDDGDTFTVNGLTFTAETTEGDASLSARKYYAPDQVTAATNLRTLLLHPVYGIPGISTVTQTAPTTTDVLTIACSKTTCLQFGQGTSASNEIAWAETTLTNLYLGAAVSSNTAANNTSAGQLIQQAMNGWKWGVVKFTNTSGAAAATPTISSFRY